MERRLPGLPRLTQIRKHIFHIVRFAKDMKPAAKQPLYLMILTLPVLAANCGCRLKPVVSHTLHA